MILELLSDMGNVLLLLIAVILIYVLIQHATPIARKLVTYYIHESRTNPEFRPETRKILKNSSVNNRYKLKEVANQSTADITIELRARDTLTNMHSAVEYYPGTNKRIRFSFTSQFPKPYIAIDDINWTYGVKESGLSLGEYRQYVIQHEFMHALGYDHQPCNAQTAADGVCPILYQSTRGPPPGFSAGYKIKDLDYTKKIPITYI